MTIKRVLNENPFYFTVFFNNLEIFTSVNPIKKPTALATKKSKETPKIIENKTPIMPRKNSRKKLSKKPPKL